MTPLQQIAGGFPAVRDQPPPPRLPRQSGQWLDAAVRGFLALRRSTASVAVYDARTGAAYVHNGGQRYDTASIVKVQILAAALHRAASHGRTLTAWEQSQAVPMIEHSSNVAATALWNSLGGGLPIAANDHALGMNCSTMGGGGYWGLSRTTATDQLSLLRNVFYGSSVLTQRNRGYLASLMGSVQSDQRWGVSAGVPAGVRVRLKNGWLPRPDHGWRINSIGHVSGEGRDYVIAVLSMDNPTMGYGIGTVSGVSSRVWQALASPLH